MGIVRIGEVNGRYLSTTAIVQGDVTLGVGCNVWHHAVIRGDVAAITLGERVNVQDAAIIHCRHTIPAEIGDDVVIGHRAVVHCRRVGPRCLIGIGAIVLDDCEIGADCVIAAGSVVPPGSIVPDGRVVMGVPGRDVRAIRPAERALAADIVVRYVELARRHLAGGFPAIAFPKT